MSEGITLMAGRLGAAGERVRILAILNSHIETARLMQSNPTHSTTFTPEVKRGWQARESALLELRSAITEDEL